MAGKSLEINYIQEWQPLLSFVVLGAIVGLISGSYPAILLSGFKSVDVLKSSSTTSSVIVKLKSQSFFDDLKLIAEVAKKYESDIPSELFILDDDLNRLYRKEQKLSKIMIWFSGLAIFISCLGLLGLVSFTINQKLKEISIRKVLGASVLSLIKLLTIEYATLILLSFLMATPIALYLLNNWLQNFAFRINISYSTFLIASCTTILLVWLTIRYHCWRAAISNPVEALKNE